MAAWVLSGWWSKAIKGKAGIMSSCHSSSPSCWPSVLPAANGSCMSYCGRDFTRKNNSSNHSRRFTLNALPKYGNRPRHIGVRVCARPGLSVCVCEADSKVYLRWMRQLGFLGEDGCQTFEVSTISVFIFEERRRWDKKKKLLSLAFTSAMCLGLPFPWCKVRLSTQHTFVFV